MFYMFGRVGGHTHARLRRHELRSRESDAKTSQSQYDEFADALRFFVTENGTFFSSRIGIFLSVEIYQTN
jgi:hypothetical protein